MKTKITIEEFVNSIINKEEVYNHQLYAKDRRRYTPKVDSYSIWIRDNTIYSTMVPTCFISHSNKQILTTGRITINRLPKGYTLHHVSIHYIQNLFNKANEGELDRVLSRSKKHVVNIIRLYEMASRIICNQQYMVNTLLNHKAPYSHFRTDIADIRKLLGIVPAYVAKLNLQYNVVKYRGWSRQPDYTQKLPFIPIAYGDVELEAIVKHTRLFTDITDVMILHMTMVAKTANPHAYNEINAFKKYLVSIKDGLEKPFVNVLEPSSSTICRNIVSDYWDIDVSEFEQNESDTLFVLKKRELGLLLKDIYYGKWCDIDKRSILVPDGFLNLNNLTMGSYIKDREINVFVKLIVVWDGNVRIILSNDKTITVALHSSELVKEAPNYSPDEVNNIRRIRFKSVTE